MTNIDKIVNSVGLISGIIGAYLVAYEVVKQFNGYKIIRGVPWPMAQSVIENPKYIKYESLMTGIGCWF